MPAARARLQVTPSETSSHLLAELSKLTGKGQATIVRELLDEANPALEVAVEAFRQIRRRPEMAREAVHRMAAQAHQVIAQATLDLDAAHRRKPGRKPGRGAAKPG